MCYDVTKSPGTFVMLNHKKCINNQRTRTTRKYSKFFKAQILFIVISQGAAEVFPSTESRTFDVPRLAVAQVTFNSSVTAHTGQEISNY